MRQSRATEHEQTYEMTNEKAPPGAGQPPRYKQAILTWLGVYPALTVTLAVLGPTMEGWPLPLRTLLVTLIMVPALTWMILPFLRRVLRGWLSPQTVAPARTEPIRPDQSR
jgi:hypothetical protein